MVAASTSKGDTIMPVSIEPPKAPILPITMLPQAGGFSGSGSASAPIRQREWYCPSCYTEGSGNVDGKTCHVCGGQMTTWD